MSSNKTISDIVDFNPKRPIKKGETKPFIEMAALPVDNRDVSEFGEREFKGGGSKFKNGDTLFARITPCLENGKTAKVNCLNQDEHGHGSTEFIVMSAKEPEYDEDYVYYLARHPEFRAYAQSRMEGTSGRQRVAWQSLAEFEFDYPDKDIRKDAGKFLKEIDDKVALNAKTNQTLEQIAQALFKSWFVDFDPVKAKISVLEAGGTTEEAELAAMSMIAAKNSEQLAELKQSKPDAYEQLAQTAALFPSATQESEHGEIPEGWEVRQLSEICKVINGRAYKNTEFKTAGTPIVRIQNLSNGGKTVYSDLELPLEKYIEGEDFIYAWSATFGPHIWRGPKSIYHYHIWKMEVDESVISRYFLYLSIFRKTEAMKNAGTGSIFTHLTKKIMESQQVLIADQAINQKFTDMIVPMFNQISSLQKEACNLADIRDALLPKLLSGEDLTLEVSNV